MLIRAIFPVTILCFLLQQCNFTHGAVTTVKTPTTKKGTIVNPTTTRGPTTNPNRNSTRIITVRIGGEGEQQCQCTLFYMCDNVNTIEVPAGGMTCDETYVCCRLPILSESGVGPTTNSFGTITATPAPVGLIVTTPYIPPDNNQPNCTCAPENQCLRTLQDVLGGGGLIDPKVTACESQQVCCVEFIPGAAITGQGDAQNPGNPNPPDLCTCVPRNQCDQDALGGVGIIDPKRPCDSSEICCSPNNIIVNPIPPVQPPIEQPQPPTQPLCGVRRNLDVGVKIIGAANTTFGEFPWMALLLQVSANPQGTTPENIFVCGASILSSTIILTAAHCVQDQDMNLLKVRAGEYDIHIRDTSNEPLPHQERTVAQIIQHQNFNSRVLYNDLALIVVSEPFTFAEHISPICVPSLNTEFAGSGLYNPNSCVATGWGKNAFENQDYHNVLKRVDLGIVDRDQCQARLRNTRLGQYFILDRSFTCAGGLAGYDTCEGDGGGPLVCALRSDPNRYIQVGIVSWGIGCGSETPGVYASLEANIDWLSEQINTLNIFSSPSGAPTSRINLNNNQNNTATIGKSNNSAKPQANDNDKKPNPKATQVKNNKPSH